MTTAVNPGALVPFPRKGLREVISETWKLTRQQEWISLVRFLISESINQWNYLVPGSIRKFYCPICDRQSVAFVHLSNQTRFSWNSVCPHCSSRGRHRALFFIYQGYLRELPLNAKVLHVAPEPAFYRILRGGPFTYHTADFYLDDVDFPREDIQRLSFKSETYDLILCNHVLEHVPDDQVALRELFRVLKPGGVLLLTVPGDFERPETKYFGHLNYNGHYRDYRRDFLSRFRQVFPGGDVADMASAHPQRNIGVRKGEWLFIGKK